MKHFTLNCICYMRWSFSSKSDFIAKSSFLSVCFSGLANYDSTNIHYRYFQPARTAPRFVNQGGQTIKVTVGDTVTIPCKIRNKGKY